MKVGLKDILCIDDESVPMWGYIGFTWETLYWMRINKFLDYDNSSIGMLEKSI